MKGNKSRKVFSSGNMIFQGPIFDMNGRMLSAEEIEDFFDSFMNKGPNLDECTFKIVHDDGTVFFECERMENAIDELNVLFQRFQGRMFDGIFRIDAYKGGVFEANVYRYNQYSSILSTDIETDIEC